MSFDPNNPFGLAEVLHELLEAEFEQTDEVGLELAMSLLVQDGFVSEEPQFGIPLDAWKKGKVIHWVMALAERSGELRDWFPYLDVLCSVDSPYPKIKFVAEEIESTAWTQEEVHQYRDDRLEVITKFKTAFNSYAYGRTREKREYLQSCLEEVIQFIDSMASEEELAIERARRWVARVELPDDGLYPSLRGAFPRARCEWGEEELGHLMSAKEYGMDIVSVSGLLLRTPVEILAKAEEITGFGGWQITSD